MAAERSSAGEVEALNSNEMRRERGGDIGEKREEAEGRLVLHL